MFCDGHCNTWRHRGCAGLSKVAFKKVSDSNDPFYCTRCCLCEHKDELKVLKTTVEKLTSDLVSIRSALNEITGKVTPSNATLQEVSHGTGPHAVDSPSGSALPVSKQNLLSDSSKFNIVLHGLGVGRMS